MDRKIDSQLLRQYLIEYLKAFYGRGNREEVDWDKCYRGVANLVAKSHPDKVYGSGLFDEDAAALKHIVWDLIQERILSPGVRSPTSPSDGWPFLLISEHGRQIVASATPTPYDPDGYLKGICTDVPTVNDAVVHYVAEAAATFRSGNFLASAVMLGAASEMIFNELVDALPTVMADPAKATTLGEKLRKGKMKDRIASLVGWCRNFKKSLPNTWSGDEQVEDVERVADLIRRRRNDAGHPQSPPLRPTRDQMFTYLLAFPAYCKHLYVLLNWARANPGVIT